MAIVRDIGAGTAGYTAGLSPLNSSGVVGTAFVTIDDQELMTVHIAADGLEEGQPHPQHIHGRFDADGTPVDSVNPTLADDADGDGFIEVGEGAASYGPIILTLDNETGSFPTAEDGMISYTRSFNLSDDEPFEDNFEGNDLLPLDLREIVLHGRSVPEGAGEGTAGEVDGTGGFKVVLPVASGEIEEVDIPAGVSTLVVGEFGEQTLVGPGQNDLVIGVAGNSVISGGAGDDVLWAADAQPLTFTAILGELNESGVAGTASITLDRAANEVTVQIEADGLEPGQSHAQHIHGRFDADGDGQPDLANGTPLDSFSPTAADDTDGDGIIEVSEGAAAYGPIILSLTDPEGSFPTAPDGSISYARTFDLGDDELFGDPLNNIAFEGDDILPLEFREIVLHGLSVPAGVGAGTDGEVDGTAGYKAVLPVATGEIEPSGGAQDSDGYVLYGNQGDDLIYGSQAFDTLFGGQDADTLVGGQSDDILYGNLGSDVLYGNKGADTLYGGQDGDVLFGGHGDDVLFGGQGNDTLVAGKGNDTIHTGEGADLVLIGDANGTDVIVDFDGAAGDRLALSADVNGTGIDSFEDLQAVATTTLDGDTEFDLGSNFVRLAGVPPEQLQAEWFVFT